MTQPIISDASRIETYTPSNSIGPFPISFPLFDSTGADLRVTLDDVEVSGWALTATQESGFFGAPNTWTNASISFATPITGTLVIEGRRPPRRVSNFAEGKGVPARDQNTELNILTAVARELFDRVGGLDQLVNVIAATVISTENVGAPIYPTRAVFAASEISVIVTGVRVEGYSALGDGGGGLYRRTTTPVAVKPWHVQTADGAWWQLSEPVANVRCFGARGFGQAANPSYDTQAFKDARDYGITFSVPVYVPAGEYTIDQEIAWPSDAGKRGLYGNRPFVYGDGAGLSVVNVTGAITAFKFVSEFDVTGPPYVPGNDQQRQRIVEGIGLYQIGGTKIGKGIHLEDMGYVSISDVALQNFSMGLYAKDVIGGDAIRVMAVACDRGAQLDYGDHTRPNVWRFEHPTMNGYGHFGIITTESCCLKVDGGSFESGGIGQTGTRAAIYFNGSVVDGSKGLIVRGVYFQGNAGDADIVIDHQGTNAAHHTIADNEFGRIYDTDYVTNHILILKTGSGRLKVSTRDNSFKNFAAGYTPSGSRAAILVSGPVPGVGWSDTNFVVVEDNNHYDSSLERPDIPGTLGSDKRSLAAAVRFNGSLATPTVGAKHNVSSVTKLGTGRYRITFKKPLAVTGFVIAGSAEASCFVFVTAEAGDGSYVDVGFNNSSNAAADFAAAQVIVWQADGAL